MIDAYLFAYNTINAPMLGLRLLVRPIFSTVLNQVIGRGTFDAYFNQYRFTTIDRIVPPLGTSAADRC